MQATFSKTLAAAAAAASLMLTALISTPARAHEDKEFKFDMVRSPGLAAFPNCLANARGQVRIESHGPVEEMSVRVEGLHAPTVNEPGGPEARARLDRRIRQGELVIERQGLDRFGRTLGRVYVNGKRITQLDVEPKARQASGRS